MVILFIFVPAPRLALSASFTGTVVSVPDGDILRVLSSGKIREVRLADIDCPEAAQAYGPEARKYSAMAVLGKAVAVKVVGVDPEGRVLAQVRGLISGRNLNGELLRVGLAWWQWKSSGNMELGDVELVARKHKVGLWQDPNPVPPWEFKKPAEENH
ncbi:MAG: thermonuclease family protein [Nitrospiria bacterium]